MWLPAVGGVLFLVAGIWWATIPSAEPAVAEPAAAEAADAGAGAQGNAPQANAGQPLGALGDAGRQLSPDQAAQLQRMLQGMQR